MIKRRLNGTELEISEVILGSDYYGTRIDKRTAAEFMDYYIENGGNTIDTARLYTDGMSETIIGEYLKSKENRQEIIISTKCAHPPLEDMSKSRLSPNEIESDIDKSLKALQTDYIDILWLHRDDESVGTSGIIDTLNAMRKKGKIRYFGASNWTGVRILSANEYARDSGQMGFCASQIQWSAAWCGGDFDKTIVVMNKAECEFYKQHGLPVFAFSAQAKGFFEKYDKGCLSDKARDRYLCDKNIETYNKIKKISNETGYSISAVVLSYITQNTDFPSFPIINVSNIGQLEDSLSVQRIREQLIKPVY